MYWKGFPPTKSISWTNFYHRTGKNLKHGEETPPPTIRKIIIL